MFNFAYAIIQKEDNFCCQVNKNNKPNWVLDNEYCYNIPVPVEVAEQYAGKYFYNGVWWTRVYDMVPLMNENGEPVKDNEGNTIMVPGETYTDYVFEAVNA